MTLMGRREFLLGAAATAIAAATVPVLFTSEAEAATPISIRMLNAHTEEVIELPYRMGTRYSREAIIRISRFMQDWRQQRAVVMDPRLIDLLAYIQRSTGASHPITLLSGYRTRETNELLRRHSSEVAVRSFHIAGKAADIRITGVPTSQIRDLARGVRVGGVGFYQSSNFVHVDTGPLRYWTPDD